MALNMMINRLQKEKKDFSTKPPANVMAGLIREDDFTKWWGQIYGPINTPYENGIFNLELKIPATYPLKPPEVKFTTKIIHPNIYEGNICLDILADKWSPALNIEKILLSISSLLCDPNPDDPLDRESAKLFKMNRELYNEKAKKYTELYAMPDKNNL